MASMPFVCRSLDESGRYRLLKQAVVAHSMEGNVPDITDMTGGEPVFVKVQ